MPELLKARVTHLAMTSPSRKTWPVPIRPALALMKAENIPVDYYRFLYRMVGKQWHWEARRILSDQELDAVINDENTELRVLYADGCPAGFFELNLSQIPDEVSITYFGLGEHYIGSGIGKWFLSAAIQAAWDKKPGRVTVTTNTLDHPAALPLYQRMGFSPVGISEEEVTAWED